MKYLAIALAWPRFIDAPLRAAKREVLVNHVAPAFDALQQQGTIAHWSHTFWGTDELETKVVRVVAGTETPTTAADAVREQFNQLGESYAWHRRQNRPGHVWANQLGLTYMDEAAAYQRLALGYFDQVPMETATDEQRAAFDKVREHMQAAADALPEVK